MRTLSMVIAAAIMFPAAAALAQGATAETTKQLEALAARGATLQSEMADLRIKVAEENKRHTDAVNQLRIEMNRKNIEGQKLRDAFKAVTGRDIPEATATATAPVAAPVRPAAAPAPAPAPAPAAAVPHKK